MLPIALLSMALATPESVDQATRLHLSGFSVQAAELILPEIDQDPSAAIALGRIFFAHSQWALSEAAYHRVPRDSPLWFRSRLEATWAAYYLDPTHERAIARALLLYAEEPHDQELRYLIGILVLHCGKRGRVADLAETMLRVLEEELKSELGRTPVTRPPSPLDHLEALQANGPLDGQQREEAALRLPTIAEGSPEGWSHTELVNPETDLKGWQVARQSLVPLDLADWLTATEILRFEYADSLMDSELGWKASCGWDSLDFKAREGALVTDSPVTRAMLLTLGGEPEGGFWPPSRPCSMHQTGRCADPRAHRGLDREARRWLRSYRKDLD